MSSGTRCPICDGEGLGLARYPRAICSMCAKQATTRDGRAVEFFNEGMGGGLCARLVETQQWIDDYECLVNGVRCRAEEARMGGVVVLALADDKANT